MDTAELDDLWRAEERDDDWSDNVESYLWAMLEPEELDADLIGTVDCRETLCRIELKAAHNSDVLLRLHVSLRQERYPFRFRPNDETNTIVVYFARDGMGGHLFPEGEH